jgi:hypothetical protein
MADESDSTPLAGTGDAPAGNGEQRFAISERELNRFSALLRYRTAFFATGSACLAFALSAWLGVDLDLGDWAGELPVGLWRMRDDAAPVLACIAAGFYVVGAIFGVGARRLRAQVRTRVLPDP